jgi:hypothetical protein
MIHPPKRTHNKFFQREETSVKVEGSDVDIEYDGCVFYETDAETVALSPTPRVKELLSHPYNTRSTARESRVKVK